MSADKIGSSLIRGIHAFEAANPQLGSLFSELGLTDATNLHLLSELFPPLSMIRLTDFNAGVIAQVVDTLLARTFQESGWRGGEHSTPQDLMLLLAELLAPGPTDSIYDPACGTGGLLFAAYRQARDSDKLAEPTIFGQEINPTIAALAKINLLLHGVPTPHIESGDTLFTPRFISNDALKTFDLALSNPPLGLKLQHGGSALSEDKYGRFAFGVSSRSADWLFVQHILASLNERGRAVVVVPPGALFVSGPERQIRQELVRADVIEAVISLPSNLLLTTGISVAIVMLNKAKPEGLKNRIVFVHANEEHSAGRRGTALTAENRRRIVDAIRIRQDTPQFLSVVSMTRTEKDDFSLMPSRYVDLMQLDKFLGGEVEWVQLNELASVIQGSRITDSRDANGTQPYIRGRDLNSQSVTVDDLEKRDGSSVSSPAYSQKGDILIQAIGYAPKAILVGEELAGLLVENSVWIIRPHTDRADFAPYLVEFMNSDKGQAIMSAQTASLGMHVRLMGSTLRHLPIAIPNKNVLGIVSHLREAEDALLARVRQARKLRHRLFSVEDRETAKTTLRSLEAEAATLAASVVRVDELEFQVSTVYPFPIAFAYRTLESQERPTPYYLEQLRVAENTLAFLVHNQATSCGRDRCASCSHP